MNKSAEGHSAEKDARCLCGMTAEEHTSVQSRCYLDPETVRLLNAVTPAGHRQIHRPETGDSECTCGEWVGPMTLLRASDPRSFAAHITRVTPPEKGN